MDVKRKRRWWLGAGIIIALVAYPLSLYPALMLIEQRLIPYRTIKLYIPLLTAWNAVFPTQPTPTILEPIASYQRLRNEFDEDRIDTIVNAQW